MRVTWVMASWVEGSAEENDGTMRSATSRRKSIFLDFKATLTFRATGHF
jgi:hypothetical protein